MIPKQPDIPLAYLTPFELFDHRTRPICHTSPSQRHHHTHIHTHTHTDCTYSPGSPATLGIAEKLNEALRGDGAIMLMMRGSWW